MQLFRFATPFEKALDILGIFGAIVAGAAQPTMSLLFGKLSQAFVNYFRDFTSGLDTTASRNALLSEVNLLAGVLAAIGLGVGLATWLYTATFTWVGERQARRIRERYLAAVLRQNVAYHDVVRLAAYRIVADPRGLALAKLRNRSSRQRTWFRRAYRTRCRRSCVGDLENSAKLPQIFFLAMFVCRHASPP